MFLLLGGFAVVALLVVALARPLGRWVFLIAALVPASGFALTIAQASGVLAGTAARETVRWIPELHIDLALRVDGLSLLLALVVTGVGALVLVYCAWYFDSDEPGLGRFAGVLLAFAGAMYGLVVADDVYLLFVFWEATSVFSYLLIGHYTSRTQSRSAAMQALLVTTLGGLVMLVGFVLLAVEAGTSRLSGILSAAPDGPLVTVAILLVLVGALSKSAIVPFHFWLPGAMAAPTPVSAYLHAAAMVKAGIYLIARLAPEFADTPGWRETLVVLGVLTMLLGGFTALRQTDLKLVLAHGTVSQLGFLTIVVGYGGGYETALAGMALLLAHALFKSTLFLVVGAIDHATGTRDIRELSGLQRSMPVLSVVTLLALGSMAGFIPTLGFVAKEAAFGGLIEAAVHGEVLGWVAIVGVALGSALTTAYCLRFYWGAFLRRRDEDGADVAPSAIHHRPGAMVVAPAVLAVAGLVLGLAAPAVDPLVAAAASGAGHGDYHLALWHGLEPALFVAIGSLALGVLVFVWRGRRRVPVPARPIAASELYWTALKGVDLAAARVTSVTQRGSLPFYLGVILVVVVGGAGAALALNGSWPQELLAFDYPAQLALAIIMIVASVAAVRATKRFQGVVLVGVTGFGMATLFALQGAPDLALTQILVEVVTLVAFVLVLRRLPARLGARNGSGHKLLRAIVGAAFGITMVVVALVAAGARVDAPISLEWPALAYEEGHGRNVVNVALVDLRGWDTMGELSVIIAAATGVASLIFIRTRADDLKRVGRREAQSTVRRRRESNEQSGRMTWLLAGRSLAPENRSILLEVVVRIVFHAIIVVSIYLLFAGHNAPGGGFAGGLVAGLALVARYLAGGREELGAAAPFGAGTLLGTGLVLAVGTATVPLLFGADALTSAFVEATVPVLGHVEFVTSTIFDIGVYLVVVGLVLDVLRSLGAQVDEHGDEPADTPTDEGVSV